MALDELGDGFLCFGEAGHGRQSSRAFR